MLKPRITKNFIPMNTKELLAKKQRGELHEECDKFCLGINYMYNTMRWVFSL
jgi:hypothetical protein